MLNQNKVCARIFLTSIFLFASMVVSAQNNNEESLIRHMDKHNAAVLVKHDTTALMVYLAKDFVLNTSGNKVSTGSEPIVTGIRTGRVNYTKFEVVTDVVYFINANTSVSMGSETVISAGEGSLKGIEQKRRYTNIWTKQNGKWMLIARHSSVICPN
jgi:hypothetical protein